MESVGHGTTAARDTGKRMRDVPCNFSDVSWTTPSRWSNPVPCIASLLTVACMHQLRDPIKAARSAAQKYRLHATEWLAGRYSGTGSLSWATLSRSHLASYAAASPPPSLLACPLLHAAIALLMPSRAASSPT